MILDPGADHRQRDRGRPAFLEMMRKHAVGIVMLDLSSVGGISEAKKIATMAEAFQLPVAPHDCTGPVV